MDRHGASCLNNSRAHEQKDYDPRVGVLWTLFCVNRMSPRGDVRDTENSPIDGRFTILYRPVFPELIYCASSGSALDKAALVYHEELFEECSTLLQCWPH